MKITLKLTFDFLKTFNAFKFPGLLLNYKERNEHNPIHYLFKKKYYYEIRNVKKTKKSR